MILCPPKNKEDFICVDSYSASILGDFGYLPMYRSLTEDSIYFKKDEEILKVVSICNLIVK